MLTKAPRGTKDILPDKVGNWLYLENLIRKLCGQYGYREHLFLSILNYSNVVLVKLLML
jgi:histidyl-tRNA synthetase